MKKLMITSILVGLAWFQSATAATFVFTDMELTKNEAHIYEFQTSLNAIPALGSVVGAFTYDLFQPTGETDTPDTFISILDPATNTLVASNDDASGLESSLGLFLTPFETYQLIVSGFSGAATGYSVALINDVTNVQFLGSTFVPLPASLWLLVTALIPMSLIRRKLSV